MQTAIQEAVVHLGGKADKARASSCRPQVVPSWQQTPRGTRRRLSCTLSATVFETESKIILQEFVFKMNWGPLGWTLGSTRWKARMANCEFP